MQRNHNREENTGISSRPRYYSTQTSIVRTCLQPSVATRRTPSISYDLDLVQLKDSQMRNIIM